MRPRSWRARRTGRVCSRSCRRPPSGRRVAYMGGDARGSASTWARSDWQRLWLRPSVLPGHLRESKPLFIIRSRICRPNVTYPRRGDQRPAPGRPDSAKDALAHTFCPPLNPPSLGAGVAWSAWDGSRRRTFPRTYPLLRTAVRRPSDDERACPDVYDAKFAITDVPVPLFIRSVIF